MEKRSSASAPPFPSHFFVSTIFPYTKPHSYRPDCQIPVPFVQTCKQIYNRSAWQSVVQIENQLHQCLRPTGQIGLFKNFKPNRSFLKVIQHLSLLGQSPTSCNYLEHRPPLNISFICPFLLYKLLVFRLMFFRT